MKSKRKGQLVKHQSVFDVECVKYNFKQLICSPPQTEVRNLSGFCFGRLSTDLVIHGKRKELTVLNYC